MRWIPPKYSHEIRLLNTPHPPAAGEMKRHEVVEVILLDCHKPVLSFLAE